MTKMTDLRICPIFRASRHTNIVWLLLPLLCCVFSLQNASGASRWVGTWSTAPQLVEKNNMPPEPGLTGHSLRQVVRVSIGGKKLRLKLSNEFGKDRISLKAVQIAVSTGGSSIDAKSNKELKFNGKSDVTLAPGSSIVSDPISFRLEPRMDLAITLYIHEASSTLTGHPGSRTTSYLLTGNEPAVVDFSRAVPTDHWYIISGLDVLASSKTAAVAIIGNSITDGRGSETNKQNRWPDILSERLLKNASTRNVGVLNVGIGGNCVVAGGLGPTALNRFHRDVLGQQGVRWCVIFEGVNDIGGLPESDEAVDRKADELISAYQKLVAEAHARKIKVYGGTIMPFRNHSYYSTYRERCRNKVNEWIRTSGCFDAVIDFDRIMSDPNDPSGLLPEVQSDYLHPNAAGHRKMGESVDLKLFELK
jgi:lysophospholipase L1-like esterase